MTMTMISPHLVQVSRRCGGTQTLIRLIRVRKAASAALSKPVTRAVHRDEPNQHQRTTDRRHDDDRDFFFQKCAFQIVIAAAVTVWLVYVVDHIWTRRGTERSVDVRRSTMSTSGIIGGVGFAA
jgi:hypothetical protein